MGGVHVSHFHGSAVAGKAAWAQGGQTTLVGHGGQRVVLIQELRELGGSEELLDGGRHRADIQQGLRGDGLGILGGHAFTGHTFHPGQTGAQLGLDELAHLTDAPVAEVVDIVGIDGQVHFLAVALALEAGLAIVQGDQVLHGGQDVLPSQAAVLVVGVQAKLAVDLVTADAGQIVTLGVEVEGLKQVAAGLGGGGVARADPAVELDQGLILADFRLLVQGLHDQGIVFEFVGDLLAGHADGLQEDDGGLLALAVDADAQDVTLVDFQLQPGSAGGDNLGVVDVLIGRPVGGAAEIDAGGTHQLGDDHTLGAADDEGAMFGHQGEVPHEDGLGLDLARVIIGELGVHVQRGGVSLVLIAALLHGMAGLLEIRVGEGQGHGLGEVLDGGDLIEDLLQTGGVIHGIGAVLLILRHALGPAVIADQPIEAVRLHAQKIGHGDRLTNGSEIDAVTCFTKLNVMLVSAGVRSHCAFLFFRSQRYSYRLLYGS